MRGIAAARGQASSELVAAIPLLIVLALAVLQLAVVGWGVWTAGTAARAGARAQFVGGSPRGAARSAIPEVLEEDAAITTTGHGVAVTVRVPSLLPGLGRLPLAASADFDPAAGT